MVLTSLLSSSSLINRQLNGILYTLRRSIIDRPLNYRIVAVFFVQFNLPINVLPVFSYISIQYDKI